MRLSLVILAACGAGQHGSDDAGDAARVICEAECHHAKTCNRTPECERCATLPVRQPPVWSAAWAREVGSCIERASCEHDSEETCVYTARRTEAASACATTGDRMCAVLDGLAPGADARVTACYRNHGDNCMPPFDWK